MSGANSEGVGLPPPEAFSTFSLESIETVSVSMSSGVTESGTYIIIAGYESSTLSGSTPITLITTLTHIMLVKRRLLHSNLRRMIHGQGICIKHIKVRLSNTIYFITGIVLTILLIGIFTLLDGV